MNNFKKPIPLIPYFKTSRYRVNTMIELAEIKPGELMADLGSGDGRISIAAAKAGAQAFGYETNPKLVELSRANIEHDALSNTAIILEQDFWTEDLEKYNIITIYPMPDIMELLEQKLLKELKPGTRVLLNYYRFLNWKFKKVKNNVYLYRK